MKKLLITIGFLIYANLIFAQTSWNAGMIPSQVRSAVNGNFIHVYTALDTCRFRIIDPSWKRFFQGYQAGYSTTGSGSKFCTFIGYQAGYSNTTAMQNTFVGTEAGYYNHDDASYGGAVNTNGSYNTFVGYRAGYMNTGAGSNTFIGIEAGYQNTYDNLLGYAEENTYIGNMAGYAPTKATKNVAIGFKAFSKSISCNAPIEDTSSYNVAIGYKAGQLSDNVNDNVLVGERTGFYLKSDQNVFVGNFAGYYNVLGTRNVSLGYDAGRTNNHGSDNVLIGHKAGAYNSDSLDCDVFVGSSAGYTNLKTNNTMIGYKSGYLSYNATGNVLLGYKSGYYETGNNKLFIDNAARTNESDARTKALIYGVFDAAVANQRLTINARIIIPQISAALTDGIPTDTEIDTATGLTPATAGAGFKVTIKDNNGSRLLYLIESDGTDWYWIVMTKAL